MPGPKLLHVTTLAIILLVWPTACRNADPHRSPADTSTRPKPGQTQPARPPSPAQPEWTWRDAHDLLLEGKGWTNTAAPYQRLPARAEELVPDAVWNLSHHTAGICVRFTTDSPRIAATWDGGGAMNHMAATGNSGLDLYRRTDKGWKFAGVGKPRESQTTAVLARHLPTEPTEYLLYLPLYHAVTELKIGVTPAAEITRATKRPSRPIVFYGTSITQGGCASRAGMCHPPILGRWLDREVINLGFSGAGKMEIALADLLGEIDAAVFVLECLPNMTTDMVRERVVPFVLRLRESRPTTPVLLVENPIHPATTPGNKELRKCFDQLQVHDPRNIHYLMGASLLAGRENGTVDGVHPTDLGFSRMARGYKPTLKRILESSAPPVAQPQPASQPGRLPGFTRSPHFDEQIKTYAFDPDVTVHLNAPSAALFDPHKPTRLVLYALPNGNTIAQTIGRQRRPNLDWHFFIQHIGAQTRQLRKFTHDKNIVVAYVEAAGRSWPLWRRKHADSGELIADLIDSIRDHFTGHVSVELTAHSGGGSLIFGYINHVTDIPDWIGRIVLLDANYGYSDDQQHGDKLLAWLRRSPDHFLGVVAYDDRRIRLNGKLVVGPTGGTYRATHRMLERLRADLNVHEMKEAGYVHYQAQATQVDIILVENPDDKILHTVLVEKNGFIHAVSFGTPQEYHAGMFWEPRAYTEWIQPD